MNIAEIIAEFGAWYQKNTANQMNIYRQLRAATPTGDVFTPIVTDDTIWRAAGSSLTRVLQPFQKAFTPIDGLSFTPAEIRMYKMKVDVAEYPDDLEATWLGFLTGKGVDRKAWPFIQWYLQQEIIPQAKEDEELNEIFWGQYATPVPGTPGDAGTSMDGINKIICDFITAGRIAPITTGAIETANVDFVTQIEDFADQINKKYWGVAMQVNMNQSNARKFFRGYQEKYGKNINYQNNPTGAVEFTNLTVNGLPSMTGSDGIWCTPKANSVRLLKKTENMANFSVENVDRQLKTYSDWWTAVGFVIPEIVFTNELFELP